jgi:hypothetical protein
MRGFRFADIILAKSAKKEKRGFSELAGPGLTLRAGAGFSPSPKFASDSAGKQVYGLQLGPGERS